MGSSIEKTKSTDYVNGKSVTTTKTESIFDGYEYTHFFICKINSKNELEWNKSFPMSLGSKTMSSNKYLTVSNESSTSIDLMTVYDRKMMFYTISTEGEKLSEKAGLVNTGKLGSTFAKPYSKGRYWYNNNYLIYGWKWSKINDEKKKSHLFFLNKISYE